MTIKSPLLKNMTLSKKRECETNHCLRSNNNEVFLSGFFPRRRYDENETKTTKELSAVSTKKNSGNQTNRSIRVLIYLEVVCVGHSLLITMLFCRGCCTGDVGRTKTYVELTFQGNSSTVGCLIESFDRTRNTILPICSVWATHSSNMCKHTPQCITRNPQCVIAHHCKTNPTSIKHTAFPLAAMGALPGEGVTYPRGDACYFLHCLIPN